MNLAVQMAINAANNAAAMVAIDAMNQANNNLQKTVTTTGTTTIKCDNSWTALLFLYLDLTIVISACLIGFPIFGIMYWLKNGFDAFMVFISVLGWVLGCFIDVVCIFGTIDISKEVKAERNRNRIIRQSLDNKTVNTKENHIDTYVKKIVKTK